jgi:hypothetical protein
METRVARAKAYEVRPRKDKRDFDLISDALPFGRLWYTKPDDAISYATFRSRSHHAVIRVWGRRSRPIRVNYLECQLQPQASGVRGRTDVDWRVRRKPSFRGGVPSVVQSGKRSLDYRRRPHWEHR